MILPASTAPSLTMLNDNDFLFRTAPSDALQGVALAKLVRQNSIDKVATLYINNDYGVGLDGAFRGAFEADGGQVVAAKAFEPNKASYRGELSQLAKAGATHLLVVAYPDDGGITIIKQAIEEGFFGKFIFSDGLKAQKIIDNIGAQYLEGAFGSAGKSVSTEATANSMQHTKPNMAKTSHPPILIVPSMRQFYWLWRWKKRVKPMVLRSVMPCVMLPLPLVSKWVLVILLKRFH